MNCFPRCRSSQLQNQPDRSKLSAALVVLAVVCGASFHFSGSDQAGAAAQQCASEGMRPEQRADLKSAEAELQQAVKLAPGNAISLGTLGTILGEEHKLEESNVYLEKALTIAPSDVATRRNLASNQFQLGRPRREASCLRLGPQRYGCPHCKWDFAHRKKRCCPGRGTLLLIASDMLSDSELTALRSFWMWDALKERWDYVRDWEEHKREAMRNFEEHTKRKDRRIGAGDRYPAVKVWIQ